MTTVTAPERSDQLEEVLLDDKRRGELLADPAKFRAFTVEYARKAMSDGEIGKAIESQTRAVLEKFVKDQGFDKPVRRLPASDDAAKGKADPDAVGADLNGKFKSAGEFYQKSWHGAITRSGIDARLGQYRVHEPDTLLFVTWRIGCVVANQVPEQLDRTFADIRHGE